MELVFEAEHGATEEDAALCRRLLYQRLLEQKLLILEPKDGAAAFYVWPPDVEFVADLARELEL